MLNPDFLQYYMDKHMSINTNIEEMELWKCNIVALSKYKAIILHKQTKLTKLICQKIMLHTCAKIKLPFDG